MLILIYMFITLVKLHVIMCQKKPEKEHKL